MTGTFRGIDYTRGSGLATLFLVDDAGDVNVVHADAGPLFRAIGASGLRPGDEIEYETDDLGTMAGFTVIGAGA